MVPPLLSTPETVRARVDSAIEASVEKLRDDARAMSHEAVELVSPIAELSRGGKRIRALATWWGFELARGLCPSPGSAPTGHAADEESEAAGLARIAASVELLHTAALIHDDIIDDAQTRRGMPATHAHFSGEHSRQGFTGRAGLYGTGAAVIAGDICLGMSEELYTSSGLAEIWTPQAVDAHDALRRDVMVGQFLDIHLQAKPTAFSEVTGRALEVLTYKSARYSVEQPFLLGAALGGASDEFASALSSFGLPLGQAFQLRDDFLGVYGDPVVTGKPAGDDLREGKKTVLIGYALEELCARGEEQTAAQLSETLGRSDLDAEDVDSLRRTIDSTRAPYRLEALIDERWEQSMAALDGLRSFGLGEADLEMLSAYSRKLVRRSV